ncbi:hypothetical protein CBR_g666 [Chara braunii]|uniref:Uncharacterized protein n=1 Tax=Chara braunii TaxID=69332 RepID=A0A388KBU9_CHABU|nr:hypothetical protein CBR_g666 [Chara braunii]|eukprot:GBG67535.1 hypothetical protein CBR_g666 [Chara braunii]
MGKHCRVYKKILEREADSGFQSFFTFMAKQRKEKVYNFTMDRSLYDAIDAMQGSNQAIHPPNLADTGAREVPLSQEGEQSQVRGKTAVGKPSASENLDDVDDGYASRLSGSGPPGKRKNERQMTFEAVTDDEDVHFGWRKAYANVRQQFE